MVMRRFSATVLIEVDAAIYDGVEWIDAAKMADEVVAGMLTGGDRPGTSVRLSPLIAEAPYGGWK